ncbi:MAG: UDP-glucose dehydrogenase family protein [Deltaproteobacteria bacterium]
MKVGIIGAGYVGLVSGACFAELGHKVVCVDNDAAKIAALKKLKMPIYEPGLDVLVKKNVKRGRLSFTGRIAAAVRSCEVIFIAIGTPPKDNGEADLTGIESVARAIAGSMRSYRLIVEKSTVPVETGRWVKHTIAINKRKGVAFDVASNPEFLREGQAIRDFMHPDRVVIGVESARAEALLRRLYEGVDAPILATDIRSAELIKHASNSFLAIKISFINAVARVCELAGADVTQVAQGLGQDRRIGPSFLDAGIGFGGFCLPKDLDAFIMIARKLGYDFDLLKEVRRVNEAQRELFVRKIEDELWNIKDKVIGVWGLAFKPDTDDMRFAPSIEIIRTLEAHGARVRAYDPQAMGKAKQILRGITFCRDPYEAVRGADCLVILTQWPQFAQADFARVRKGLRQPLVIDGRNMFSPAAMKKNGLRYVSIGRGAV